MARRPSLQAKENRISILIEGPPEARGDVGLGVFISALSAFQVALRSMKSPSGRPRSAFSVADLSHSSPATVVLAERTRGRNLPWQASALMDTLQRVRAWPGSKGRPLIADVDVDTLVSLRELTALLKKNVTRLEIYTPMATARIDRDFDCALEAALGFDEVYRGLVAGRLERVNLHNDRTFYVYPTVGPAKVACEFDEELRGDVTAAVDRYVTVTGELRKRSGSRYAHSIHATSIHVHPKTSDLPTLKDIAGIAPGATGDEKSEDFVRRIRRENW